MFASPIPSEMLFKKFCIIEEVIKMKSKTLTYLWEAVLSVDDNNYFGVLSVVESAYESGIIERNEYIEMKKQLDNFRRFFIPEVL